MNVTKVTSLNIKERMTLTYCLIALLSIILIDLAVNYDRSNSWIDLFLSTIAEVGILAVTLYMSHYLWSCFIRVTQERVYAQQDLEDALDAVHRLERRERVFNEDFSTICRELFKSWGLTKSEAEIAHLLLTSKSLKNISAFRFTSEGTLKNQARSIYQKAQVKNRIEFMALIIDKSTLAPAMNAAPQLSTRERSFLQ